MYPHSIHQPSHWQWYRKPLLSSSLLPLTSHDPSRKPTLSFNSIRQRKNITVSIPINPQNIHRFLRKGCFLWSQILMMGSILLTGSVSSWGFDWRRPLLLSTSPITMSNIDMQKPRRLIAREFWSFLKPSSKGLFQFSINQSQIRYLNQKHTRITINLMLGNWWAKATIN